MSYQYCTESRKPLKATNQRKQWVLRSDSSLYCLAYLLQYAKLNKMVNEVERYLTRFTHNDSILCPHPTCKAAELVLSGVMAFKNHTARLHKIFLRQQTSHILPGAVCCPCHWFCMFSTERAHTIIITHSLKSYQSGPTQGVHQKLTVSGTVLATKSLRI